ncbi:unnamed protein product [Ixodes pacificus]
MILYCDFTNRISLKNEYTKSESQKPASSVLKFYYIADSFSLHFFESAPPFHSDASAVTNHVSRTQLTHWTRALRHSDGCARQQSIRRRIYDFAFVANGCRDGSYHHLRMTSSMEHGGNVGSSHTVLKHVTIT